MVTKLIKNYELEDAEYIISALNPDARNYKVYYKGKELKDVTAIVRIKRK